MLTDTTLKRLNTIGLLSKQGKQINGLFRLMENEVLWKQAYINIKGNDGAVTKGVDEITLDGFSYKRIQKIIQELKVNEYQFQPVRRTYIPKKNGKKRPLGIPNGNDKLVQEVVKIILEEIYEPIFSNNNHGFRKGRSCHTALTQVKRSWTGTKWLIEMDIKSFFDNLNHEVLIKILSKKIQDKRFLLLINKMLKAGFLDYKENLCVNYKVASVNSKIISINRYLKWLDVKELTVKTKRTQNASGLENMITKECYLKMLRYADAHNKRKQYCIMKTIAQTGIRIGELKYVTVEAIKEDSTVVWNKGKYRI